MRKELVDILYYRHPAIFAEHIRLKAEEGAWNIWCRDGWVDLVDALCEQLQYWTDAHNAPQIVATDVKEKFGELRFVVRHKSAEQIGALRMACALSTRICDHCGAPGRHVVAGGTWMVRCEAHVPEGAISVVEYKQSLASD